MFEGTLKEALRAVFGGGSDISAANPLETHDPTIEDVEAALTAIRGAGWTTETLKAIKDAIDAMAPGIGDASAAKQDAIEAKLDHASHGLAALKALIDAVEGKLDTPANFMADLTTLEARLTAVRAGYLDQLDFNLAEAIAAIPTTMRGTDGAALAAVWTAALATALGDYTAAKAAFLDEAISAAKVPKSTDESGSFPFTTGYGTNETDISALFTTALTGITRRKYSVYLDLTGPAGDAAAWTKCTVKVKVKVDGANYRTIDKKDITKADVAAAEEPGVPIDIPPVAQDAQVTMQFDVALAADQTIYYHYVKGVLE
ncbi:hypothetical protein ES703_19002 [subsurface metagenome]